MPNRAPFKKVFHAEAAATDIEVKAAPGAGKRLGIVKMYLNTLADGAQIQVHFGANPGTRVLTLDSALDSGLVIEPGTEDFPEEGPENVALNITASGGAFNATIWGYVEDVN